MTYRPYDPPIARRHRLRPGVADQNHRDGARSSCAPSTTAVLELDEPVGGGCANGRGRSEAVTTSATCWPTARACRRTCRSSAITPGAPSSSPRSAGLRSGRAAVQCRLQRPRLHPAWLHPRRRPQSVTDRRAMDPSATLAAQFRKMASFLSEPPLTFNPSRGSRRDCADRSSTAGGDACSRGKCTTRTRGRSGAAGHAGLFGNARGGGRVRARGACDSGRRARPGEPGDDAGVHPAPRRRAGQLTGARRGTPCCPPLPAERGCPPPRSDTPASPARRCGSTGRRDLYIALLTNRVHPFPGEQQDPGAPAGSSTTR